MGYPITIRSNDDFELSAHRADPEGPPTGAVVVVQEVFGITDHIRAVVDRYAANGYVAVAPALFDRIQPGIELAYDSDGIAEGIKLARGEVDLDQAVQDLVASARSVAEVGKVGIVGFCWGGLLTALCAIRGGDTFAAASSYYGGGTPSLAPQQPVVPMIMHFGKDDHAIPLEDVRTLQEAWPDVTMYLYDGAGHGFNCDHRQSFDAASAAQAEERTLEFFAQHLS